MCVELVSTVVANPSVYNIIISANIFFYLTGLSRCFTVSTHVTRDVAGGGGLGYSVKKYY